ncbi:Glutathione S-transferase B [Echinococcus granulosus]|nr:Glutathione S-transferase B [Echinococcus granulosus]
MSFCKSCCGCYCCCHEEYDLRKAEAKAPNENDAVFEMEPTVPELEYIDDFVGPPLMLLKPTMSPSPLSPHTSSSLLLMSPPTPLPTSSPTSPPQSLSASSSPPTVPELQHVDNFIEPPLKPPISTPPSSLPTPSLTLLPSPSMSTPPSPPIQPKATTVEEMESAPLVLSTASVWKNPKLGYWNIRERAEQIRIFCHYFQEDYQEELYEYGPGPEYSTSEWDNRKRSEEFAELELPYWIEEGVRLCGTAPILEHIADRHNLLPSDRHTRSRLRKTQEEIDKLRGDFEGLCYDEEWLNYPDFNLYDLLDMLVTFAPDCLRQFENLENFMLRFEGLQSVKAYITTEKFKSRPFFSPKAFWNGGQK